MCLMISLFNLNLFTYFFKLSNFGYKDYILLLKLNKIFQLHDLYKAHMGLCQFHLFFCFGQNEPIDAISHHARWIACGHELLFHCIPIL